MTDLDLTRLREIAEAATPGPWGFEVYRAERRSPETGRLLKWKPEYGHWGTVSVIESDGVYGVLNGPDAVHIGTFDPLTVLALLDEIERLRSKLENIREIHEPIDAVNTFTSKVRKVCTGCGTDDGNWAVWPCATRRACDGNQ